MATRTLNTDADLANFTPEWAFQVLSITSGQAPVRNVQIRTDSIANHRIRGKRRRSS